MMMRIGDDDELVKMMVIRVNGDGNGDGWR